MKNIKVWFNGLTVVGRVAAVATAAILSLGVISATAQPASPSTPVPIQATIKATPKIEVKQVVTTEAIPFTSSTTNDNSLEQGVTQTQTEGVDGVLTHTIKVTYTDGVETSRSATVDTVTIPAINKVIVVGTKIPAPICGNGTYVNSAGNTVCSPYSAPSVPSGASAKCGDGTYSFSQSRSGTCSHHGGVSVWL